MPIYQKLVRMREQARHSESRGDRPRLMVIGGSGGPASARSDEPEARFRDIYERWFGDVVKWLYALGMPSSDTEDLAQEIFLVVRRKLDRFDGGNLAGWLYRIAQLTVRDHRRRAWFKNLTLRRRRIDLAQVRLTTPGPDARYEDQQNRRRLQALVAGMSEKLRTTFVLFEIEGYSGDEIARIQDVPLGTVWTRLHLARKEFWKLLKKPREVDEPGR
jgi:RNA polymerase sigma-70 factor (ECF subfamily)